MKRATIVTAAIAAVAASACLAASPQEQKFPAKTVRLIVPLPPGGGTDMLARTINQKVSESWGHTLVIDNRGGAGGTIGVDLAAKSPPDGYTIVMGYIAPITVNVSLMKLPYDPVSDLAPITILALAQNVLVVTPSLPVSSTRDVIALLKSKPGQYNYASAGNGSSPHLSAELFKLMTGVSMNHVPYKGAAPALIDVISGQVAMYFGSQPSSMPHVKGGRVRAIAVTGVKRSAVTPELPTIAESGVPGFESIQWYGLLAPAKTPPRIIERLNRDFVSVLHSPDVKDKLFAQGFETVGNSPREFALFIRNEIAKWAKVVKEAQIRTD